MRTIQYFLIGLFLSLCTIPAFASCPVGFTDVTSQYLSNGGDVSMGTVCENIVPFDFGFGPEKGMFFWDGGVWDNFGTANGYDLKVLRSVGYLFPYVNDGTQMGAFRWDGADFIIYDGDSFLMPYFGKVSFSGGGGISTPVALFNIDGIKDNIFVTLLSIVGALLMLLVFKYAWSKVKDMLGDSGYDYYERSVPIGNSGLTRDTLYSNDGTVQSISYSNQDRGLNENSESIFNTGASKDWDDLSSMRTGFESHWDEDGTFTGANPRG